MDVNVAASQLVPPRPPPRGKPQRRASQTGESSSVQVESSRVELMSSLSSGGQGWQNGTDGIRGLSAGYAWQLGECRVQFLHMGLHGHANASMSLCMSRSLSGGPTRAQVNRRRATHPPGTETRSMVGNDHGGHTNGSVSQSVGQLVS